jgi:uncharacterized protein (TIGR02099 family)
MPAPEDDAIAALLSPRVAAVRWQIRAIKALGLLLVAAWGLLIAAWIALHSVILPHIDRWRAPIQQYASQFLGQPVRIGEVIVNSRGWLPTLELRDVALLDAQARAVLQLPRVVGALSAKSIFALQPRFTQLLIDGADLEVHRDADGRVFVAGFEVSAAKTDHRPLSSWLFKQHEVVLRNGVVRWSDALHPSEPQRFTDLQWVMRNSLRRHDLRIDVTPPENWGDRVTLIGRFTQPLLAEPSDWRRWRGTLYASVPKLDVAALQSHVTLPAGLTQAHGAVRAWIEVAAGQADVATLDVALREVRLKPHPDRDALAFADMSGRLVGRRDAQGMALEAREFGFATPDGLRWPASTVAVRWQQSPTGEVTGGQMSAEHLDLALMAQVTQRLQFGEVADRWLAELNPRGRLEGVKLSWDGAFGADSTAVPVASSAASAVDWRLPARYDLRATVSGLTLASAAAADPQEVGRPGVRNADLVLRASEQGGEVRLAMKQGELDLPGVLAEPLLPLDRLEAVFHWRVETPSAPGAPPQVVVTVPQASFANADLQGEVRGNWSTGSATPASAPGRDLRFPGRLELDGLLTQVVAARVARYLPLGIDAEARHYVEQAVQAGRLSRISVRVKGDLNEFPFADARTAGAGEFRVVGQVEDLRFAYVPSWPATATEPAYASPWPVLEALSGELVFDRLSMEIRNAQATTQGVKLTGVQGGIKRLDERPVLVLEGAGRGGLVDMLRYVNASPVGGWIGNALAQSTATGQADLKLTLTVPLATPPASTVRGSVALAGSDFRLRPGTPVLSGARGRIDFSQQGFSIVGGAGKLLGGDLTIDGGLQPDGSMRFVAQGTATADGLRRSGEVGAPVLARLASSLSGQTAYRVALNLVNGKPDVLVTSNLVGLGSDLPPPLRKAADAPLALRFQTAALAEAATTAVGPARDVLRLDLGNLLQAQYVRDVSAGSPRVLRGGIGVMEPAQLPASGVAATLNLTSVNLGDWQRLGDGVVALPGTAAGGETNTTVSASAGYLPTSIGLRAQEVQIGSRRLNQVSAKVAMEGSLWRVNLESEQASGTIEYRPPRTVPAAAAVNGDGGAAGAAGRIYARLTRLSLPKEDTSDVETLLDQPPQSVPALDIVVDDLVLRGKRLGRMELDAVNRAGAREWRLTRLALTTPEARLTASGNWAAVPGVAGTPAGASAAPTTVRRVTLNFNLELGNGGALIERLGFGKLVKGGKGGLSGQIAWDGSPLSMDYPSLTGQINLSVAAGQFLKADPGMGRLLGVLSLQALPRRFVLDFRDVFQQGFAFDDISGDLQIAKGVAQTNNLRMRGVQAAVLMEGKADIEQETQDLRVIVVPEIDAGTASLAYAAINPAIGLGAFLAQTLFSKPLIAASTREFRITGSWAEPKVDKVERGLTDTVPNIPAPSVAPPPPIPAATSASESEGKP